MIVSDLLQSSVFPDEGLHPILTTTHLLRESRQSDIILSPASIRISPPNNIPTRTMTSARRVTSFLSIFDGVVGDLKKAMSKKSSIIPIDMDFGDPIELQLENVNNLSQTSSLGNVKLAVSEDEKQHGLMFRDQALSCEVGENRTINNIEGMIFAYPIESRRAFWMKNTNIPLEAIWFNKEGYLIEVPKKMDPNSEFIHWTKGKDAKYGLELHPGCLEKLKMAEPRKIRIKNLNQLISKINGKIQDRMNTLKPADLLQKENYLEDWNNATENIEEGSTDHENVKRKYYIDGVIGKLSDPLIHKKLYQLNQEIEIARVKGLNRLKENARKMMQQEKIFLDDDVIEKNINAAIEKTLNSSVHSSDQYQQNQESLDSLDNDQNQENEPLDIENPNLTKEDIKKYLGIMIGKRVYQSDFEEGRIQNYSDLIAYDNHLAAEEERRLAPSEHKEVSNFLKKMGKKMGGLGGVELKDKFENLKNIPRNLNNVNSDIKSNPSIQNSSILMDVHGDDDDHFEGTIINRSKNNVRSKNVRSKKNEENVVEDVVAIDGVATIEKDERSVDHSHDSVQKNHEDVTVEKDWFGHKIVIPSAASSQKTNNIDKENIDRTAKKRQQERQLQRYLKMQKDEEERRMAEEYLSRQNAALDYHRKYLNDKLGSIHKKSQADAKMKDLKDSSTGEASSSTGEGLSEAKNTRAESTESALLDSNSLVEKLETTETDINSHKKVLDHFIEQNVLGSRMYGEAEMSQRALKERADSLAGAMWKGDSFF